MPHEHVLITGATGYIGQAVAQRFQSAGYTVSGLARSTAGLAALKARHVAPIHGDLDDTALLRRAVADHDVIIDTATADHAPSTAAFLHALRGTGKTYLRTSGTGVYSDLGSGTYSAVVHTELTPHEPAAVVATRWESDLRVQDAHRDGIRTIVIRPSMIYGDGASEQLPLLIRHALTHRRSLYVGEGTNRWSNVYLADLAEVYLLAVERAAPGAVYNIGSGEAAMRDIANGVARLTGLESAQSCAPETAFAALGRRWVEVALASNSRVDSAAARAELGWRPVGPDLLDELTTGSYRRVWASKGDPHDHTAATDGPAAA